MDSTCEGHCQRLQHLLEASAQHLEDRDKRCLQQLLQCVQQLDLDAMMPPAEQTKATDQRLRHTQSNNRIVATVQPYSNCCAPPSAPPTPSKRSSIIAWQSSSLSESGVFVECDLSTSSTTTYQQQQHPHLQYYQERLDQLERKILVYESAGETQAQHLSQRLQREVLLEKESRELSERLRQLVEENALLEEAKCEFEEAENDTRLHLQRNEVELEITRQRNVELEFSKDALSAKYKDCRAECLILREDLAAAETQLEHLHEERQRTKQQLEALRRSLPLLLICRLFALAKMGNDVSTDSPRLYSGQCADADAEREETLSQGESPRHSCDARELSFLREEVKVLRTQLKDLDARHYEAMESADSHWAEQEQEYKEREEAYLAKEASLKQKIAQLQDCLREDSRAAAEKIQQLEETELGLKTCLVRLTKEHRDILEDNRVLRTQAESHKAQEQLEAEQQMAVALENERRRCQALIDDLSFAKKLQASTEEALKQEAEGLRSQMYDLRKNFMHIEVTNGELKEEVGTLENKIRQMESQLKESEERARCLEDELRTKDEQCQRMEREIGVIPEGFSLAHELYDSPAKRAKREEIKDLHSASRQLGCVLRDVEQRQSEADIPTHKEFQVIACSVKQLADQILAAKNPSEVSTMYSCHSNETLNTVGDGEGEGGALEASELRGMGGTAVQASPHPSRRSAKSMGALRRYRLLHGANSRETKNKQLMDTSMQISEALESPNGLFSEFSAAQRAPICMETLCEFPAAMGTLREPPVGMELVNKSPASMETLSERPASLESFLDVAEDTEHCEMESKQKLFSRRRKRNMLRRYICSRVYRGRVRRRALQRKLSSDSFYSMHSLHTVHSDTSMLSLHPQHASIVATQSATACHVSIVQTESTSTCVQEVQTEAQTLECGIQCDEVDVEQRLLLLPERTRRFVELLEWDVEDVPRFRASLLHKWESSESFREHIELVQDLYWAQRPQPLETLEVFGNAIAAVRELATTLQPKTSFTLKKIEQHINERVVNFHCQQAKEAKIKEEKQAMQEKEEKQELDKEKQEKQEIQEKLEMQEKQENQKNLEQLEQKLNPVFTLVARPNPLFELMGVTCKPNQKSAKIQI